MSEQPGLMYAVAEARMIVSTQDSGTEWRAMINKRNSVLGILMFVTGTKRGQQL